LPVEFLNILYIRNFTMTLARVLYPRPTNTFGNEGYWPADNLWPFISPRAAQWKLGPQIWHNWCLSVLVLCESEFHENGGKGWYSALLLEGCQAWPACLSDTEQHVDEYGVLLEEW
jgi:hypothetical protein